MSGIPEQMVNAIRDIKSRRVQAPGRDRIARREKDFGRLRADATTAEDIDTLQEARGMLDPFAQTVLDLMVDVWGEFGKYRCGVCGQTDAQSEAIGYDCIRECKRRTHER